MHNLFENVRLCVIVVTVNLMSLMAGMMLTWTSPVLSKLTSNETLDENPLGRVITTDEQSWIAALASIGGIIGPPLSGLIMEKFGRKFAIAFVHLPNVVATLTAAFGNDIWYYYISRLAAGMSINSGVSMGALYFGEIGESRSRGVLYSTTSIFINAGTLLSYCIGPYTSIRAFNLILLAIVSIGIFGTLLYVPESPYYLLQTNQLDAAHKTLAILRGPNSDVDGEIKLIQENIAKTKNDGFFAIFKTNAARKSFAIALGLITLQPFSGINVIYSYTQIIFEQSGSKLSSDVSSILVGVAQLVTIFITTFGVDRFGRKKMLTFASTGLAFTLGVLGTFFRFQNDETSSKINWLPLVCLMLYFLFFNSGLGGLPFLYMSEILPLNVKSAGSSLIMVTYCFVSFLITFFYNNLTDVLGTSGSFYFYAGAMVCFALYVLVVMFETRGKTLEEINYRLDKSKRTKGAFSKNIKPGQI